MILKGKKGFEKPIEIFIVLFIIIVVSTVVLRLFKSEMADKTGDLAELKKTELTDESIKSAITTCREKCSQAERDGCSPQSVTSFCGYNVGPMDLDGDSGFDGYDENLLGGIGVCEEKIMCPLLVECTCGKLLDLDNCADVMCGYWDSMGLNNDDKLDEIYNKPGNCSYDLDVWTAATPSSC